MSSRILLDFRAKSEKFRPVKKLNQKRPQWPVGDGGVQLLSFREALVGDRRLPKPMVLPEVLSTRRQLRSGTGGVASSPSFEKKNCCSSKYTNVLRYMTYNLNCII